MNLDILKLKYLITFGLSLFAVTAFSQVKPVENKPDPAQGDITDEIEVVRPYKPVLADAVKIRRSPDLNDNKPFKPNLTYSVLDKRLELNTDIRQLQAQKLADEKETTLQNNFVKIGVGNFNTGLGEIYMNTGKDEALQAGFFVKHLNQKGSLPQQRMSRQQAGIFGRSILENISLNGEIAYDGRSANFFNEIPDIQTADKQRFNMVSFKGELLKNYKEADNNLNYAVKADAYMWRDRYNARESSFALSGFVNKAINQFNFGLNASMDVSGVKSDIYSMGNHVFKANPYVKFQGDNYQLTLGLNAIQQFGIKSQTDLFPAVTAEFSLVPQYATLFAGLTGDVNKTTFRDQSLDNPYITSVLNIRNSIEKTKIYGGIKGNAGAGFGFKASAFYKKIENLPLFFSYADTRKFDLTYDSDATIIGFEGEINAIASEVLTWTGKVVINDYQLTSEKEAWYKPDFQLTSNVRFSVNKRLTIDGDVLLYGNSQSLAYVFSPTQPSPTPVEQITKMKSFVDLSAGAEYRLKNKIGIYARVNNMFGENYQRYLNYPRLGLNVIGGFNYSF